MLPNIENVVLVFVGWCLVLWCLVCLKADKEERRRLFKMTAIGLIGGAVIDLPYSRDFLQVKWWPYGSAAFGGICLGSFVCIHRWWAAATGEQLVPETTPTIRWPAKARLLSGTVAIWAIQWSLFGVSSVVATANALLVAMVWMMVQRQHDWHDLIHAAKVGVISAGIVFGFTVGGYLLLLGIFVDVEALAASRSSYFARYGAGWTATALTYWTAAFGAFWGTAALWGGNQRFRSL